MIRTTREKDISIKHIYAITFTVLLLASNLLIGYVILSNWKASALQASKELAGNINQETAERTDSFLQIPYNITDINQKMIENGVIDLSGGEERDKFFASMLASYGNYIYSFSYGTVNGEYYGARRNEDGAIEIMKNNAETGGESWYYSANSDMSAGEITENAGSFDPRTRDWYKAAIQSENATFSPVYKHFVIDDLAISVSKAVYDEEGTLMGVLGTHLLLSSLNEQLKNIVADTDGYAFIVEANTGYLVANSIDEKNYTTLNDGTTQRIAIETIDNNAVATAFAQYKASGDTSIYTVGKNGGCFVNIQKYSLQGIELLVVSAVPEAPLMQNVINNIYYSIILNIVICIISIAIGFFISRKLFKPIGSLLGMAERFANGDLSQRTSVVRKDEIGRIAGAVNDIADKLQFHITHLEEIVKIRTEELDRINETLEAQRNHLHLILDSIAEAVYGTDIKGSCTFCNKSCLELLGYSNQEDLLEKNMHQMIHHSRKDGTPFPESDCPISQAIHNGKEIYSNDDIIWKADGTFFNAEYNSHPQYYNGKIVGSVLTFVDISKRKKDEERIKYLSCHDAMTGLSNRRCFETTLEDIDKEENLPISIIFIDLNGLKLVNDIYGHSSGDQLIINAAEVMKSNCREEDIVARVGGDEFAIALVKTEPSKAAVLASRLKNEFSEKRIHAIACSMAVGIAAKTRSFQRLEKTMEVAESEMYKDKAVSFKGFGRDATKSIIASLHEKSPWDKRHSEEVKKLCGELGMAMSLTEAEITRLCESGYLHDIGKIALDENILSKNSETLSEAETEMIRQHPAIGYRILNLSEDTLDLAEGIYGHHERWDGTGYPKGLKGKQIPLFSRIISVVEVFERRHSAGKSKEEALRVIQDSSGSRFDPDIADLFINLIKHGNK